MPRRYDATVLVVALVSDLVTLVDLRVSVELDESVSELVEAPLTVLVTVLAPNVVDLAEIEIVVVVVTVMDWLAVPRVEVKDVAVKLRISEDVVVGVVVVMRRQVPQVAPWQDTASTTKHQAPPVAPSGLQQ